MLIQIFYKYRYNTILVDLDENLSSYLYFVYTDDKNIQLIHYPIHYAPQSAHFTDCYTYL